MEARASERKKDRPARRLAASAVNKGIGRTGFAAVLAVERNLVAKGSLALKVQLPFRRAPEARTGPPLDARSRVLLEGRVPITHQRTRKRRMVRTRGRKPQPVRTHQRDQGRERCSHADAPAAGSTHSTHNTHARIFAGGSSEPLWLSVSRAGAGLAPL